MLYTTMIMTFTVGVDLGFVLGCFLLIFYHIASMIKKASLKIENRRLPVRCPRVFFTLSHIAAKLNNAANCS